MKKAPPKRHPGSSATLALVMIARDEAASIARCLRSVSAFVDQMIVLDTGSTDATASIARDLGAQVHHWPWQDDFALARNQALSHSTADWNLVLDADEWIVGDGRLLRQAIRGAGANSGAFLGLLPIHSSFNLRGTAAAVESGADATTGTPSATAQDDTRAVTCSWLPRLLPRGVRYVGRIHEHPQSGLPRRQVALEIGHDGYLRHKLDHKKGRNRKLLLKSVDDEPGNAYLHYQLGKDYEVYDEHVLAIPCYEQALHLVPNGEGYRHDLVVRTIFCLKKAGLLEIGYQCAQDEMPNWQHSPDFFFVFSDLLIDLATAEPKRALSDFLPLARQCLLRSLSIGDQPQLEGSVQGRGSHIAAKNLVQLNRVLAQMQA